MPGAGAVHLINIARRLTTGKLIGLGIRPEHVAR
jgi:hypothetical protein